MTAPVTFPRFILVVSAAAPNISRDSRKNVLMRIVIVIAAAPDPLSAILHHRKQILKKPSVAQTL